MLSHENTHTVHMKSQRSQSSFNLRLWSSPIATSNVNESDARVAPADVGSMTGGNGALFRDITAYDNYSSSSSITRLNRSPLPLADDPSGRHAFSSSGQRLRTPTLTSTTATTTTTSNSLSSNQNNYSNHKPPNFKQVANSLHKSNSRSVFNLYSPNVGSPNSHPFSSNVDHLAAQSTSRKGSIALKNILLDRLLSKPSTSSTHDSSSLHHISHSNPSRPWSTNTGSSPSTASSFGKLVHRLQYGSNSTFELRSTETRKSMGDSDSVGSNNAHHHLQQPDSGLGRTDSERSSGSKIVLHQQKSHQPQKKKNKKSNKKDVHLMRSHSLNDLHALPPESNEADFNWKRYGDAYQAEIRKRRHEMYITEIEMDSVMQTGPTLRYDSQRQQCCTVGQCTAQSSGHLFIFLFLHIL